jgi:hypothetical protein
MTTEVGAINPNLNNYHSDPKEIVVHYGYQISPTGGGNKKEGTPSTPISPMWRTTYFLSYLSVSELRAGFRLGEM